MTYTSSRIWQWLGILLALGIIATGYYYFRAAAGVKTNVSITDDPLALGLAGYWKLDDGSGTTATDSSARGNNGTLNSGPTWTTGQIEGALNFDGADDNVTTAKTMANSGTVSVWVNSTATINSSASYYALYATASGNTFFLSFNGFSSDNRWDFSYRGNFGTTVRIVGPTLTSNSQVQGWHLLTATWDVSSGAVLYVDGQRVSSTSTTTLSFASMSFGLSTNSLARWAGKLDEVRMYDRILTADEVLELYRLTSPSGTDTSLKGYWSFNGRDVSGTTAYDRSGAGNNGTLTNGPTVTPGKLGQALDFWPNGSDTNAYVTMGDPSSGIFDFGTGDFSVSFFIKTTGFVSQGSSINRPLFKKGNINSNGYGFEYTSTNKISWLTGDGTSDYSITSPNSIADNTWHFIVGLRSSGVNYLYVDGVSVGSLAFVGSVSNTSPLAIGSDTDSLRNTNASIDEVRIYNRALSAAEIQSLYQQGQSDETNTSASQPQGTGRLDSGLAGYWKLDDGSGTSATDSSTNANTGTLTNGPTWTTGQIGGAVSFDGTDDYITTGSTIVSSDSITLSAWVNGTSAGDGRPIFGNINGQTGSDKQCLMYDNAGVENISFGPGPTISAAVTLGTNTWHHVVYVNNGTSHKLFLDGRKVNEVTGSALTSASEQNVEIGGCVGSSGRTYFPGYIDEARIYRRPLSEDEVAQLYRLTSPSGTDTSLKGYWSFNGNAINGTTAYDRSGAGNNGTLTNGPTITEGKLGQALQFDGTDDYVATADYSFSNSQPFTMSVWFRADNVSSEQSILTKATYEYNFRTIGSTLYYSYWNASASDEIGFSYSGLVAKQWYLATVTYDGSGTAYLYINGSRVASDTNVVAAFQNQSNVLQIGGGYHVTGNQRYFNGLIDEVRIYNRALSAAEIQSLYKQGQSDETNTSASQPQGVGRLDSGLAGYWKLDDGSGTSATDSSTNGNTGTLTNGPTWTTGQIGGAVDFDGADDYINTNSSTSIDSGVITVSAWVYPRTNVALKTAVARDNNGSLRNWILGNGSTNGTFRFSVFISNTQYNAESSTGFSTNSWHYLTGTYDGKTVQLYVDGVNTASTSQTGSVDTDAVSLTIGARTGAEYFNSKIDEVRIYNRALSSDEVSQLYRLTSPSGTDTSLKGYWSFNGKDVSGTTAYDRSGAGNNGTLTNGPAITEGRVGQALSFDGSNAYVNVPDSVSLSPSAAMTVSFWTKVTGSISSQCRTFVNKNASGQRSWHLTTTTAGKIVFTIASNTNDTGTYGTADSAAIVQNKWVHVVAVFDGAGSGNADRAKIFADGVQQSMSFTGTIPASLTDTSQALRLGEAAATCTALPGLLDEVRIYNRALTASEITALYQASK